ncbi:MAG: DNA-binding response regulator [Vicingaceae bacterium]|nr:MAG: DNA-binding response regulator [Vicingaceae bacterium]
MSKKILIVDDDPDIREILTYNLKKENYLVFTASNGKEALEKAQQLVPDLILLDIMMPEMDGIETCQELRKLSTLNQTYIVFLSARGEEFSQLAAFDAGGDDYIVKPIKPKVLISKLQAMFKRTKDITMTSSTIHVGPFIIDKEQYTVLYNNKELNLPKKEFELLSLLMSKPSKVFHREEILQKIWGNDIIVGDRTIDVHIRKIREKIGNEYIKTVKGVGYKFELPEDKKS